MKITKEDVILFFIALVAFGFRLFYAFRVPFFSSDTAYFHLRHSEYITQHFVPLIFDPLSYGGNTILNTHLFHYFLAFFDIFFSQSFVYKVIPAFLASSIVLIVYLLAKDITKNEYAAFFGALLAAFVPVYIKETINQVSLLSVFIPVFLLLLYALLNIEKRKSLFLFLGFVLVLLDPLNFLMLFTLLVYAILLIAESIPLSKEEKEGIGFFVVLLLFVNLVLFRQIYLEQGLGAVYQNLPLDLYGSLFQDFNLFETIATIGFIPLILGVAGFLLYREKNRIMILLGSVVIASFILLLLKLIPFEQGVLFLAIIFCITATISVSKAASYLQLTKMARFQPLLMGALIVLTLASLIIPSVGFAQDVVTTGVTAEEVEALAWIQENTPSTSVIAGNVYEGNLILYLANRTNVIDTQFFYAENRIFDIETIFTSESLVKAKKSLDAYSVDYIYFSSATKELYGVDALVYTSDEACFLTVFENEQATIYEVVC